MEVKVEIATIQQYADAGYTVQTHCWQCQKYEKLDLGELRDRGFGKTFLSAYQPACQKCGEKLQKIVSPPVNQGGRPKFLMKGGE